MAANLKRPAIAASTVRVHTPTTQPAKVQPATYGDFVEAMRRNEVFGHQGGQLFHIKRMERCRNWAIPSYDFGHLLDPNFRGNVLHRLPPAGTPVLVPPKDRAFLFTFGEERQVLVQRFGIDTYPDDDGGHRFWFYAKAPDSPWLSMDRERRLWEALVFDATYLLANPLIVETTPDRATVSQANRHRRLSGATLVPPTRVLQLTRVRRLGLVAQATGLGSPKRPHERVGHERRLRDGRVIPVRACEIHKDCAGKPQNLVMRP